MEAMSKQMHRRWLWCTWVLREYSIYLLAGDREERERGLYKVWSRAGKSKGYQQNGARYLHLGTRRTGGDCPASAAGLPVAGRRLFGRVISCQTRQNKPDLLCYYWL